MPRKVYYTWTQFGGDIQKLAKLIKKSKKSFDIVYGPKRGALPTAVCLSHTLNFKFLTRPRNKKTLVVDDIIDTGKTLEKFYKQGYFIAAIFYHRQSYFEPNIWLREKKSSWIVFPWENI
jgi:hypoxanthine phosphoribosyltransferase